MGTTQGCYKLFWTNPGSITPWNCCTATYLPSKKNYLSKKTNKTCRHCWRSKDELVIDIFFMLADQQKFNYISSVQTQDVVWKIFWEWWMRKRESVREICAISETLWYHTLFPTADTLIVNPNRNITTAYYIFGGPPSPADIGLIQNFELKIMSTCTTTIYGKYVP